MPIIPAVGFDDCVFRDEAGVGDGIFFVAIFDGQKKLQRSAELWRMLGWFAFECKRMRRWRSVR